MAEVLHELAEVIELPARRRMATLRKVLSRAEVRGARIEERGSCIVVQFDDTGTVLAFSVDTMTEDLDEVARSLATAVSSRSPAPSTAETMSVHNSIHPAARSHGDLSPEDVARAVNEGVLTEELNEAVAWDPELAV